MTREEAIKKLRQMTLPEETREILVALAPELAESEDERIINTIISFLRVTSFYSCNGCKKSEMIAWLEKQKEQHPSPRFLPGDWAVYDGPLGHAILQVEDVLGGRYTFVDNDSTLLVEDSDKFLRPLTPKDVEKPAEWSDEDDWKRKELIQYLEEKGDYRTVWMTWLKSLPERFNLEPKEEWSDEDTEMYINVASSLRGYACGLENEEHKRHIQKGLDWLENRFKSLHPQPKQEWSKEDEEMLTELLLTIEPSDNYDEMRNWLLLKLKSLLLQGSKDSLQTHWKPSENIDIYEVAYERYPINNRLVREVTKDINEDTRDGFIDGYKYCDSTRWKPSEEQIEAIKHAYNSFPNDCPTKSNLMFLYRDLKKLM